MKLIKLTTDHYIIVDGDLEIKKGDWHLKNDKLITCGHIIDNTCKKITHSTIPKGMMLIEGVKRLSLQEVKELIGEVDVEKKAKDYLFENYQNKYNVESNDEQFGVIDGYTKGYNQCLEDNKDRKYTDEDVIRIVEKSRETGLTAEYLIMTFQPKTEWEVEFVDGKFKLK